MSNLDQFTINYKIQVNAAIQNLTRLNQATARTNTNLTKTGTHIKTFASGATAALGQLVPKFNGVSHAMRIMNADFAAAAIGVGLLTAAVGTLMKTRADYNTQRKEGMDLGFSSTRLEDYQRKFVLNSKGQINRQQTYDNLKRLQENTYAAYTDPIQFNQQAKTLKLLGISPGVRGEGAPDMTSVIQKLATVLNKYTDEQARGIGRTMGLDPDFVMSLRNQGANINNVGLSAEEVQNRVQAEKSLDDFNQQLATLDEKLLELAHAIGVELMPGFISFVTWVQTLVGSTKDIHKREEENNKQQWIQNRRDAIVKDFYSGDDRGFWGSLKDTFGGGLKQRQQKAQAQAELEWDQQHVTQAASDKGPTQADLNGLVDGLDKSNATALKTASDIQLAVNMFAQSVSTFANAIDERTAWAAWAGVVGKANGLQGPGSASGPGGGSPSTAGISTAYDTVFAAAGKKYGVDPAILKNIARVESSMNPSAENGVAGGLMGINHSNYAAYGITNPYSASQSVDAGAKIFSEYLKKANGDVNLALMMYHGGLDQKGWGPLTKAYPGKVMGGSMQGIGFEEPQKRFVQSNIAAALGMPLSQFQRGGATRGDAAFAFSQFEGGLQNNMFSLNKQLAMAGLRQADRSKLMTELRDTERGLALTKMYEPEIMKQTRDSDERPITQGARPIVININGGTYDPKVLAAIVSGHLSQQFGDVANSNTTAVKQ